MKDIMYLTVQATLETELTSREQIINEVEKDAVVILSDTQNVQFLETKIIITNIQNPKK
ncbi:MAG TPA: hypothetical protein VGE24_11520 [Emticicia sp.]